MPAMFEGGMARRLALGAALGLLGSAGAWAQLSLSSSTVQLDATNSYSQFVFVLSSQAATSFTIQTNTAAGGNWLQVFAPDETTPAAVELRAVNVNTLADGTYTGSVVFRAPGSPDAVLAVTLVVGVAPGQPGIQVSPHAELHPPSGLGSARKPGVHDNHDAQQ